MLRDCVDRTYYCEVESEKVSRPEMNDNEDDRLDDNRMNTEKLKEASQQRLS